MKNASRTIAVGLALWAGAALADAPEVTPYRPTVSNPAALSAPGLLEFEAGVARFHDDAGTRLYSLPYLFKYAFSENFGVLVGGDAYLRQETADGNRLTSVGNTVAALKLRHELTDNMALGVETGVRFPTAKTGLGAEKSDYLVNGIFSAEWGGLGFDLNLAYTRLGSVGAGEDRGEIGWATAVSGKLGGPWGWAAELSGTGRRGTRAGTLVFRSDSLVNSPPPSFHSQGGTKQREQSAGDRLHWQEQVMQFCRLTRISPFGLTLMALRPCKKQDLIII